MKPSIGIIGGGAAGLFAALHAARNGAPVFIWESNSVLGRKLAVTGSGRGNLSNTAVSAERYTCDAPQSLELLLKKFSHDWLRRELARLGILTICTEDGWCYPASNAAAAVADILTVAVEKSAISVLPNCRISNIRRDADGFILHDEHGQIHQVARLIIAAGGKAHPQLGADDGALGLLAALGVTILPMRPALAPLVADVRALHKMQGVRLDVAAELYDQTRLLGSSQGNLIFTQYGFSGPAAMDLSHFASLPLKEPLMLKLNFLPQIYKEFKALHQQKKKEGWPLGALLESVLPVKAVAFILTQAGLSSDKNSASCTPEEDQLLYALMTDYRVSVKGTKDFHFAQLAAGGVPLSEVDPDTMESRKVSGLYLAGEILDVVGPCGGFNLHFAFASGAAAGLSAARYMS